MIVFVDLTVGLIIWIENLIGGKPCKSENSSSFIIFGGFILCILRNEKVVIHILHTTVIVLFFIFKPMWVYVCYHQRNPLVYYFADKIKKKTATENCYHITR